MDLNKLKEIRKLVLIAMFADDYLMERFVLKGGAALDCERSSVLEKFWPTIFHRTITAKWKYDV